MEMHKKQQELSICLDGLIATPLPPPVFHRLVPSSAPHGGRGKVAALTFLSLFIAFTHPHPPKTLRFPFILIIHQFMEYLIKLGGLLISTVGIKLETNTTGLQVLNT